VNIELKKRYTIVKQHKKAREKFSLHCYSCREEARLLKITPKRETRRGQPGRGGHALPNEPKTPQEIEERYSALLTYLDTRQVDLADIERRHCALAGRDVIFLLVDDDEHQIERVRDYGNKFLGLHVYSEPVAELIPC
jgi:hypothetical protein